MNKYPSRSRRRDFAAPAVSPNTTYAGETALPYVAPALKLAKTLTEGWVRQIDGIQNKAVISSLTSTGTIVDANCDWSSTDSLTLGERVLTLTDVAVMEELCRGTLLPTWVGAKGARNSMTAGNPEFVQFSLATVAGYTAQGVENGIWKGINLTTDVVGFLSNDAVFDSPGYRASILAAGGTAASPNTNEETVTANGFTAANILGTTGAFAEVYNNAVANCPAILNRPDVAFYCSPKTAGAVMQALAKAGDNQGVNMLGTNQGFPTLQYLGIPIHTCPGMFDEALVLTYEDNLVVGSNLNTDYTSAQYIDAWQYDGSDNVKISMRFGLGMQVGIPTDVVVGAYTAVID